MHHKSKRAESRHTSPLHDMSCRLCYWCLFVRSLTKGHLLCYRIMRQKAAGKHLINILSPSDGYTSTGSPASSFSLFHSTFSSLLLCLVRFAADAASLGMAKVSILTRFHIFPTVIFQLSVTVLSISNHFICPCAVGHCESKKFYIYETCEKVNRKKNTNKFKVAV